MYVLTKSTVTTYLYRLLIHSFINAMFSNNLCACEFSQLNKAHKYTSNNLFAIILVFCWDWDAFRSLDWIAVDYNFTVFERGHCVQSKQSTNKNNKDNA